MKIEAVESVIGMPLSLADDSPVAMRIQDWAARDEAAGHVLSLRLLMTPSLVRVGKRGVAVAHGYSLQIGDSQHTPQGFTSIPIAAEPVERAMREGRNALVAALLSRPDVLDVVKNASPALFAMFKAAGQRTGRRR